MSRMRNYLLCYDIRDRRRLARVKKCAYDYALSGQKSALEVVLDDRTRAELLARLEALIDHEADRIHLVAYAGEPRLYGRGEYLDFDEGTLVL
ncbi:CRISPR-associated endonuclease Cas2 [Nitratifractor sp.]